MHSKASSWGGGKHNSWIIFTRTDRLSDCSLLVMYHLLFKDYTAFFRIKIYLSSMALRGEEWGGKSYFASCRSNRFSFLLNEFLYLFFSTMYDKFMSSFGSIVRFSFLASFDPATEDKFHKLKRQICRGGVKKSQRRFFKRFMIMNCLYVIHKFIFRLTLSLSLLIMASLWNGMLIKHFDHVLR